MVGGVRTPPYLYLTRMQVHRYDMVAARNDKHIRYKLRRNRGAALVLLVDARVGEAGDDGGDAAGAGGLAGGDEDEELHEVVVDVVAAALDDEDVFVSNRFGDFDVDFAIGELFDGAWYGGYVESVYSSGVVWGAQGWGGGELAI